MSALWERYQVFERSAEAYGLIVGLLALLIFLPVVIGRANTTAGDVATAVLGGAVGVLSLRSSGVRSWAVVAGVALWVLAVAAAFAPDDSPLTPIGGFGLGILLFGAPIAILGRIVRHVRVTAQTVLGAVAVYLEIGVAFAALYVEVYRLDPAAFPAIVSAATGTFTYFSFVTLATVGFGDIVPALPVARSLTVFEALIGQMFLVVVVARIVALLGSEAKLRHDRDPQE